MQLPGEPIPEPPQNGRGMLPGGRRGLQPRNFLGRGRGRAVGSTRSRPIPVDKQLDPA